MRAANAVRLVDELGRVVLPIELRRNLNIDIKDPLEIYVNGNEIFLKKYIPKCIFCESEEDVVKKIGKNVCHKCIVEVSRY